MTVDNLRLSSPEQVTLTGKGRKTRIVPILKKTAAILSRYIEVYNLDCPSKRGGPLFFNVRGDKLTRQGISYIIKKYADTVNLDHVTPLGHSDLKTTQVYSKTSIAMKKKAIESLESTDTFIPKTDSNPAGNDWCHDKDLMKWLKSL